MKRKLHLMMAVAIVAVAGLAIYANQPKEEMSDVMLANIEALAGIEQPNIDDCIEAQNYTCIALHPANPNLDKRRPNAKWK